MVTVREFRIPVPLSLEEYRIAQLYMIAKMSAQESDNDDGDAVEVLCNAPFDDGSKKGQFTHKLYHFSKKVPAWLTSMVPKKALTLEEKSWNAFPQCLTIITNPYFTKFRIVIESSYVEERSCSENPMGMRADELAKRVVEHIDVVMDPMDKYVPEEDLSKFRSKKAGRGPFAPGWQAKCDPIMFAYKLVTVDAPYWGFGPQVEKYISKSFQRKVHTEANRRLVAWMDEWYGLSMEEVRKMEAETFARLNKEMERKKTKLGMNDTVVPINDKVPKWGDIS